MKLYLIAGEASGDARGAELIRALSARHPSLQFFGAGGPEMRDLSDSSFVDWAGEAVVGLWDVLKKYPYFRSQFNRILAEISQVQPDALILVDYPGFNLRIAQAVKRRFPKVKIINYISPQVWAWNRGRIPKMARYLDLMLCIFPFEVPLYAQSGLPAVFVGHPMLDSLETKRTGASRDPNLVGLFPGSRKKEVSKIFPAMVQAIQKIQSARPQTRFEAAAASHELAEQMIKTIHQLGENPQLCPVTVHESHSLMQRASAGIVCSGTATLEAAFFGLPMSIVYKVATLTWIIGKQLIKVPFLGMPNVLAGREIVRELLQNNATPDALAQETIRLLNSPTAQAKLQEELATVTSALGDHGAADRAAEAIILKLERPTSQPS